MKRIFSFFRGNIRVEAQCRYPERFINICAQNGVEFWDLRRTADNKLHITVHISGYRRLMVLANDAGFTIKPIKKAGVPFFAWKIRKRYVLLAGTFLCVALVWFSSFFIWEINVSGNETVPTAEILAALEKLDIGIGTCRLAIDQDYISNEMLIMVSELCWLTVNTHGSRADVIVREEIPVPEMIEEDVPTLVIARKSGIITKMEVLNGKSLCQVGDTVLAGDTLVTGVMDSISSGNRLVHAMAKIYARTWYELSAQIPLETLEKSYTGETKTKYALIIAGKRVNLYFSAGIPWGKYDKITEVNPVVLPGNTILPLTFVKETYSEYNTVSSQLTQQEAEGILKEHIIEMLNAEIDDQEITKTSFTTSVSGNVMTVTLEAECLEEIAVIRDLTAEEIADAQKVEEIERN